MTYWYLMSVSAFIYVDVKYVVLPLNANAGAFTVIVLPDTAGFVGVIYVPYPFDAYKVIADDDVQ